MPQVVSVRKPSRLARLALSLGPAVVAVIIGGVIYALLHQPKPQPSMQNLADQTIKLQLQGKPAEAIKANTAKFNSSTNKVEKYQLALGIGNLYEGERDYHTAISWYEKAQSYATESKDRAVSKGLGRCYEDLGDKAKASEYYQIVLDKTDRTKIGWEAEVNWYTAALKRVKQ